MERLLALELIRVTEAAAIASARLMGRGDTTDADRVAVEAMRRTFDEIPIDARIVIGEGERDEAPMLYIGERVGDPSAAVGEAPEIDIAVDPLEGTNLVAHGQAGAITVLAASERGGLLHAPDCYMEKLCVGPVVAGKVDITAPPAENLRRIAAALGRGVNDITVVILERPRHEALIAEVRAAGARIKLICDGDLSAAICVRRLGHRRPRRHGDRRRARRASSPPPRCAASAARSRPASVFRSDAERERARGRWATATTTRVYRTDELASGENLVFAATGVTKGDLLEGVRFFGGGARTHSLVMAYQTKQVRFVDTVHMFDRSRPPAVRL